VAFLVTFVEYDLLSCSVVNQWTEEYEDLSCLGLATLNTMSCEVEEAGSLGNGCCEEDESETGYVVEYTTYDFGSCTAADRWCEPLGACGTEVTACDLWGAGQPWPLRMYVVEHDTFLGAGAFAWSPASLAWAPLAVDFDPSGVVAGQYYPWEGCTSQTGDGGVGGSLPTSYRSYARYDFRGVGGPPTSTWPCGMVVTRTVAGEPDCLDETEITTEPNVGGNSVAVGGAVRLSPDPVYLEYYLWDGVSDSDFPNSAPPDTPVEPRHRVMDESGLDVPPPGLTTCPKPGYPATLPASLTVTLPPGTTSVSGADIAGSYPCTYSDGLYRGSSGTSVWSLAVTASDWPDFAGSDVVAAHFVLLGDDGNAFTPAEVYLYDTTWTADEIDACSPVSLTNGAGATVTE
jgi:hypothetical protein